MYTKIHVTQLHMHLVIQDEVHDNYSSAYNQILRTYLSMPIDFHIVFITAVYQLIWLHDRFSTLNRSFTLQFCHSHNGKLAFHLAYILVNPYIYNFSPLY